jgi:hypothetical protein
MAAIRKWKRTVFRHCSKKSSSRQQGRVNAASFAGLNARFYVLMSHIIVAATNTFPLVRVG